MMDIHELVKLAKQWVNGRSREQDAELVRRAVVEMRADLDAMEDDGSAQHDDEVYYAYGDLQKATAIEKMLTDDAALDVMRADMVISKEMDEIQCEFNKLFERQRCVEAKKREVEKRWRKLRYE